MDRSPDSGNGQMTIDMSILVVARNCQIVNKVPEFQFFLEFGLGIYAT